MSLIDYDSAIFVTDGESLISIQEDPNYAWMRLSWITDRDFLCVLSHLLVKRKSPKMVMRNGCAQISKEWLSADHHVFTYHEWVAISQNFIKDYPLCKGEDEFSAFYRYGTEYSKERLKELTEALTGLFRLIESDLFVVYATKKALWEGEATSLENLYAFWDVCLPKIDEIIRVRKNENHSST